MLSLIHFKLKLACAQLVNVTGRCRQRRGFPAEEPVILVMDYHEHNWFNPQSHWQFIPTQTFRFIMNDLNISNISIIHLEFDIAWKPHLWPSSPIGRWIIIQSISNHRPAKSNLQSRAAIKILSTANKDISPSSWTACSIQSCRPSTSRWPTSLLVLHLNPF